MSSKKNKSRRHKIVSTARKKLTDILKVEGDYIECFTIVETKQRPHKCSQLILFSFSFQIIAEKYITIWYILQNLTPVWKCVKIELPPVSCLNNFGRLDFVICLHKKDLLHHCPKHISKLCLGQWCKRSFLWRHITKSSLSKLIRQDTGGSSILTHF